MKRRPNTKKPKPAFTIRSISLDELEPEVRDAIAKSMADHKAGRTRELKVGKSRGMKILAPASLSLDDIPAEDMDKILQNIVDHCSAQKRRRNTKSKLPKKTARK